MDTQFVKNKPYFEKTYLQGAERENNEAQLWETATATPLLNTFLPIISFDPTISNNKNVGTQNSEKLGIPNLSTASIDYSQAGGEIMRQDHINHGPEILVYTRKGIHWRNKDLLTTLALDQSIYSRLLKSFYFRFFVKSFW
ncbi:Hypothetical predicted protein [Olea europaea subsp. europaea]|uniref:Uncharacterized protein n=1 Tax=Olea europaea subsp. europaea TaxID=158383 RepID=A0A8S0V4C0_OLEEU|nr:Hypothetical predicted protein [Olea europaea subsp. europaea]